MTAREYIDQHAKIINNHLVIGPMSEDGPYCAQCFEAGGEINRAPFNKERNGWVCSEGHIGPNQGLASGGVTYGPR